MLWGLYGVQYTILTRLNPEEVQYSILHFRKRALEGSRIPYFSVPFSVQFYAYLLKNKSYCS